MPHETFLKSYFEVQENGQNLKMDLGHPCLQIYILLKLGKILASIGIHSNVSPVLTLQHQLQVASSSRILNDRLIK